MKRQLTTNPPRLASSRREAGNRRLTASALAFVMLFTVLFFALAGSVSANEERWFSLPACGQDETQPECGFPHLLQLVVSLINFLILLSTILATAAFAYAGILLITSGGNPGKKDEAKKIFMKVLIGFLWILGAWLLVYTISTALLKDGFFFLGGPR